MGARRSQARDGADFDQAVAEEMQIALEVREVAELQD